ncbi:hypothetical protein AYI70_g4025 [Smittium culicis]|uniref:Uncharacterized protein n=1 Tax=Smittium culicis TaxID=133412 RepID=A0A1R1Y0Y2_9FUNG|nr:hypothetical protein AYI70_g4025 [Smittium culicis]
MAQRPRNTFKNLSRRYSYFGEDKKKELKDNKYIFKKIRTIRSSNKFEKVGIDFSTGDRTPVIQIRLKGLKVICTNIEDKGYTNICSKIDKLRKDKLNEFSIDGGKGYGDDRNSLTSKDHVQRIIRIKKRVDFKRDILDQDNWVVRKSDTESNLMQGKVEGLERASHNERFARNRNIYGRKRFFLGSSNEFENLLSKLIERGNKRTIKLKKISSSY